MIFSAGQLSEVGRVIKTHGYEGKLRFELFNGIEITQKEPVFMMFDRKPVPFFMTEISNNNPYIVAISDVNSLEQAQRFLNKSLYLPVSSSNSEDEESLIGFEVIDTNFGNIGTVKEIIENSAQDLLVVDHNGQEIMIPFVDAIIMDINDDDEVIQVNTPDGLFELEN